MLFRLLIVLLLGFPISLFALSGDPDDDSKADSDGPHVFYRGNKISVKYVLRRDTGVLAKTMQFSNKKDIEERWNEIKLS